MSKNEEQQDTTTTISISESHVEKTVNNEPTSTATPTKLEPTPPVLTQTDISNNEPVKVKPAKSEPTKSEGLLSCELSCQLYSIDFIKFILQSIHPNLKRPVFLRQKKKKRKNGKR